MPTILLLLAIFTCAVSDVFVRIAVAAPFFSAADLEGKTVLSIGVEGNKRISKDTLVASLKSKVGQPYRGNDINDDVKTVFSRFGARCEVRAVERDNGVGLVLVLDETRVVDSVETTGVEPKHGNELLDEVGLREVRPLFESAIEQRARELEQRLKDDGHFQAEVKVEMVEKPSGPHAIVHITEGEKVAVEDIVFTGVVDGIDVSELRDVMTTDTATLWVISHYLQKATLDGDLVAIEKRLRQEGWRDATVALLGVDLNAAKDGATVRIQLNPGTRYMVEKIEVTGAQAISEADIRAKIELVAGGPLRMGVIAKDEKRIESAYGELGYVGAKITPRVIFAETGASATVRFEIEESTQKHVRDVRILGNAATLDEVIRRRLTLEPGEIASSTELARSIDRVRALGFFDDNEGRAHVDGHFEPTSDPLLEDVFVDVDEAHAGRFFISAFASTDLGFFGGIQLQLDNFDITDTPSSWNPITLVSEIIDQRAFHGAGQQLEISLLPGSRISTYRLTFVEPYLFGPEEHPRSLRVDLYSETSRFEEEFQEAHTGVAVTYGKEWTDQWTSGITGRIESVNISNVHSAPNDVDDVEGSNFVPSIGVFANYVNYDSLRDPRSGLEAGVRYDLLFADGSGQKLVIDEKGKIPLYKDEKGRVHTLNIRSAIGLANGFSGDLPFFERFQGGGGVGDFPLRGFEYRGIGPESKGVHLGGHFGYAATVEYEFPLYSTYDSLFDENLEYLRGVTFVDFGSVEDSFSSLFGNTRASVGAGLRIKLPFLGPVPIALDFAAPFLDHSGDNTEIVSVRISYRF